MRNGEHQKQELNWPLNKIQEKYGMKGVAIIIGIVCIIPVIAAIVSKQSDKRKLDNGLLSQPSSTASQSADEFLSVQSQFENHLSHISNEYKHGLNDIQKSASYREFSEYLANFLNTNGVEQKGWKAYVESISTDRGGSVVSLRLKSSLGDSYNLNLANHFPGVNVPYFSYSEANIPISSPVYKMLGEVREGSLVKFDFAFIPDSKTGIKRGINLTEKSSTYNVKFIVSFNRIEKQ